MLPRRVGALCLPRPKRVEEMRRLSGWAWLWIVATILSWMFSGLMLATEYHPPIPIGWIALAGIMPIAVGAILWLVFLVGRWVWRRIGTSTSGS